MKKNECLYKLLGSQADLLEIDFFKEEWLHNPLYNTWIRRVSNDKTRASCALCMVFMNATTKTVYTHATKSKRHIWRVNINNDLLSNRSIDDYCIDTKAVIAEITLSALICDRDYSYNSINYLMPVLKNILLDSEILKNIKLYCKKAKYVVKHIIAPEHQARLSSILKKQKFSIIIDESTDISVDHSMAIVVKYEDENLLRIHETIWDIFKVYTEEDSLASAVQL